jgi:hypothetical protein
MAGLSMRGRVSTMVGRLFNHANPNSLVSRLRPRRSELLRELIADVTVGTSQVVRASGVSRRSYGGSSAVPASGHALGGGHGASTCPTISRAVAW